MNYLEFEFYIDGREVGLFKEAFPTSAGRYGYEPYRGLGHLDMCRTIDALEFARCFYIDGADVVHFDVRFGDGHGLLNLSNFERVPKHSDGYEL